MSGRRRGPAGGLARGLLRLAEVPYALAMRRRNRGYDTGRTPSTRLPFPVVSVGNLSLGGTGKTPVVEWLARWFREQGVRVALVSRGYKAEAGSRNDEARELEQRLPDVPHVQFADRVAAAQMAREEFESQLILLDDGFQHRRLARDLDVVLLDATAPWGYGHVFPRGTLREPREGLSRADVVGLSRADMLDPPAREAIRRQVAELAPRATWVELAHRPARLVAADGQMAGLDTLGAGPVAAFCGVGNPAGFRHTLAMCGYAVAGFREYPDHHPYTRGDLEELAAWVNGLQAQAVVCTHKDLVKIGSRIVGGKPLWAVAIEVAFLAGQAEFEARLHELAQAALAV